MKSARFAWYVSPLLLAVVVLAALPAEAHHSAAMFDRTKTVKLVGTVVQFGWTNPHSWISMDVPNANGQTERWSVECNSPNNLARMGWKSTSLKPGDKVTVLIHPLRNGDKGGSFMSATLEDGTVLNDPTYNNPKKY